MTSKKQGPAVARRKLAASLRKIRKESGKTQVKVAKSLDWSTSKLLRLENGQSSISMSDLLALLTQFPAVDKATVEALVQLGRLARRPTLGSKYQGVLTKQYAEWLEYEAYAASIRHYETKLVPGPLQIEPYATALVLGLSPKDVQPDIVSGTVAARMERAAELTGPDGPSITYIVDEAALRRGVGNERGERDYSVMIEQLRHLKRMNTRGRRALGETIEPELNRDIGIHVVPFDVGAYQALKSPFELLEFEGEEEPNMAYFEHPGGDIVIREMCDETADYIDMFHEMENSVPTAAETGSLIDAIIRLMEEGRNGVPAAA